MMIGTEVKHVDGLKRFHDHLAAARELAVDLEARLHEGESPSDILERFHEQLGAARELALDIEARLYEGERGLTRIGGIAA